MKRTPMPPRKTPLQSRKPFESRCELQRRTPADPALPKNGRSKALKPIPIKVRQAVADRSGFVCELGCGNRAVHLHHRKLRSQGGRHEPANLLHLCAAHHNEAHANPERSYALGWLVRGWADPAGVPVILAERAS